MEATSWEIKGTGVVQLEGIEVLGLGEVTDSATLYGASTLRIELDGDALQVHVLDFDEALVAGAKISNVSGPQLGPWLLAGLGLLTLLLIARYAGVPLLHRVARPKTGTRFAARVLRPVSATPDQATILIATSLLSQGLRANAISELLSCKSRWRPIDGLHEFLLAEAYALSGDVERASAWLVSCLEIDPTLRVEASQLLPLRRIMRAWEDASAQ